MWDRPHCSSCRLLWWWGRGAGYGGDGVSLCSWCCMDVKLVMMSASPSHTTVFRHVFPCLAVSSHEKHATKLQTWLEIGHAHPKHVLSCRIAHVSHLHHSTLTNHALCFPPPPRATPTPLTSGLSVSRSWRWLRASTPSRPGVPSTCSRRSARTSHLWTACPPASSRRTSSTL